MGRSRRPRGLRAGHCYAPVLVGAEEVELALEARHYPGLFWSATTSGHVWYESRLELDRLWLADFDPEVEWIASQPVWLCGTDGSDRRRHAPDRLLKRRDGGFWMVDVKPEKFASLPKVAAVFGWTSRVCGQGGTV